MAELRHYDIPGAFNQGFDRGRQMRQTNTLNQLASQAYGAPQAQQESLVQQAIANDAGSGLQLGQSLATDEDRRTRNLVNMSRMLTSAPEQARPRLYQQMLPALQRFGVQAPTQYDDTVAQTAQAIVQAYGGVGGASGVQSTYVDGNGNRVAIMRDGSTQILGQNDAGMSQQTLTIDVNGTPTQVTFDKRTGRYTTANMGGSPASAPGQPVTESNGMQVVFDNPEAIPPHVQAAIQANPDGWGAVPDGTHARLPDYQRGTPLVGRRAEDEAAAVEAAKQAAQIAALPQRQAIETQGAIDRTRGTEQAKADIDRQKGRNKARLSLDQATARIGRVDSLVESIMPRIGAMTAGWGGNMLANVPGTAASDLRKDIGTLQAIAGFDELNAMRASSPTGGALGNVTERELAFLQSVVRNIETSQSPEQLRRNLQDFQREVRGSWQRVNDAYELDYGGQYAPAPSDGLGNQFQNTAPVVNGPRPGDVQDGYRFRGGDPSNPSSWERI